MLLLIQSVILLLLNRFAQQSSMSEYNYTLKYKMILGCWLVLTDESNGIVKDWSSLFALGVNSKFRCFKK